MLYSTATHPSLIDIMLTNRPRSFQSSVAIETGLSDHHKMVLTVLKCHFVHLQPTTIDYRDYKYFDPEAFINDIKDANLDTIVSLSDDPNSVYSDFCAHFKSILDLHAPLKSKTLLGNQAPFMSKDLSKAIMTRSRLKKKFNRQKTKANWKAYTLQRNKCVQLCKKAIKNHFSKSLDSGDMTNKTFWKTVRPFISNKGTHDNHDIILDENGELIKDNREVSEILNSFYVNIVEQTMGMKPSQDSFSKTDSVDEQLDIIIEKYKAHPSIQKIKDNNPFLSHFSLSCATEDMILRILLSLNVTKGAAYDTLPPKVIRLVSAVIASPLTGIINLSITKGIFPDLLKTAFVVPAFKKKIDLKKKITGPLVF